ncbi:MAG: hypothetical protein JXD22_17235 [Sedimentisphaerales bacterium]|nr:hypothetical protein [Sedimentisphaerales bacterium]
MAAFSNHNRAITGCVFLLLLVSFFQADLGQVSAQSKLDFLGLSHQADKKASTEISESKQNAIRKNTTPAGIIPYNSFAGKKVQVVSAAVQSGLSGKNSSNSQPLSRFQNSNSLSRLSENPKKQVVGPLRKIEKLDEIKTIRSPRNQAKKPIKLISVDYQELPFQDVINDIRSRLGINILVFWPALEQTGINRDIPVTLKLNNISPGKVLAAVLDYVAGGTGQTLAMEIDQGVLEINLKENLGRKMELKTYYVGDLLHQPSQGYSMTGGYGGGMGSIGGMGGMTGSSGLGGFGNQGSINGQNRRSSSRVSSQRNRSNRY